MTLSTIEAAERAELSLGTVIVASTVQVWGRLLIPQRHSADYSQRSRSPFVAPGGQLSSS